jgi:DNA invertase Pin-like site-specific DNA recombinase
MSDCSDYYKFISAMGKAAMRERAARGERMHQAPLGWRIVRDAEGRARLEKDPQTWPLVQEALELRSEGVSVRAVCLEKHRRGLRSKREGRIGPGGMQLILERASEKPKPAQSLDQV